MTHAMKQDEPAGREPVQRRSRERVERILAAATALIASEGSDALRMSEVATRAGVSIGSLYQYFPDKAAIIRRLAERYHETGRGCIAEALAEARDLATMRQAFSDLIDVYYAMFLTEPVLRDVWSGTQADPSLRAFELAETRLDADIVVEAIRRVGRGRRSGLEASVLLIMHLGETTMRLASSVPRCEADQLVAAFKRMALVELFGR